MDSTIETGRTGRVPGDEVEGDMAIKFPPYRPREHAMFGMTLLPWEHADALARYAEELGLTAEVHGSGTSRYVLIDDELLIRCSNHSPAQGGGYNMVTGYRHGDANLSVHPGGAKPYTAVRLIREIAARISA